MAIHAEQSELGHRLMNKKSLPFLASSFLLLTTASAADAAMILRLEEVGGDVVVRGSGTIKLSALADAGTSSAFTYVFNDIQLYAGPAAENNDGQV